MTSLREGETLLEIKNLCKSFPVHTDSGTQTLHALSGVNLTLRKGEVLSVIGESGCGKTTLGKLALRLLEASSGELAFHGRNVMAMDARELKDFRRKAQMVFQNPFAALNPRRTIESTIMQPMKIHYKWSPREIKQRVDGLLEDVGISPHYKKRYPHQFSGGQRQRINIARALASKPEFIVCDEAVSALDVSVQAQVLNLLLDLQDKYHLTYLFISHDLGTVKFISDRICVMYLGKVVEFARNEDLTLNCRHPYSRMLYDSHPEASIEARARRTSDNYLFLPSDIPSPLDLPQGCAFQSRCPRFKAASAAEQALCRQREPALRNLGSQQAPHFCACHFAN